MIARGGFKPIILSLMVFIVTVILAFFFSYLLYYISGITLLVFIFGLYFFRDPSRDIGDGIVSPADGRILHLDRKKNEIAIFMSLSDVHVNRAPSSGTVTKMKHFYGAHHPAYKDESENNEKNLIQLDTEHGRIDLMQITGIFARRIVPYVKEGDEVEKGDRIGLIRFGSRVEMTLPQDAVMIVDEGEKLKAGEKIGVWNG